MDAAGEDVSLRPYFAAAALLIAADALLGSLSAIWGLKLVAKRPYNVVWIFQHKPIWQWRIEEQKFVEICGRKSMPLRESNMLSQDILDGAK